jgi:hypothetical protein
LPVIPEFGRLKQENRELEASLGYKVRMNYMERSQLKKTKGKIKDNIILGKDAYKL